MVGGAFAAGVLTVTSEDSSFFAATDSVVESTHSTGPPHLSDGASAPTSQSEPPAPSTTESAPSEPSMTEPPPVTTTEETDSETTEEPPPPPPPEPEPEPEPQPEPESAPGHSPEAAAVVDLVNQARSDAGCGQLQFDERLVNAAQAHSSDMANRDYFSHESPEGTSFVDRANAAGHPSPAAENIAMGARSADQVMQMWLESPGHRGNILNCDLTTIGVGLDTNGWYWTQVFGR